jgi:hypothetical protein
LDRDGSDRAVFNRLGTDLPRTRFSGKNSHQAVVALELLLPMVSRLQQSIEIQPQLFGGQGLQNIERGHLLLLIQQPLQRLEAPQNC